MRTLYSSSSPRVRSPSRRRGISIVSLRKPDAYSRASGTVDVDVSNATSRCAHSRLSPLILPTPNGSKLNSAGRIAPNTITLATTNAPRVIASMRPAGSGFDICPSVMSGFCSDQVAGKLVFHQHEAGGENERIGYDGRTLEACGPPPLQHDREHDGQCDQLPKFDTDIESDHVRNKPIGIQSERLQLGGQAESMDEPETRNRNSIIGLHSEHRFEATEVIEGLIDHRETDDGVHQIRVDLDLEQHSGQQGDAVTDGEQRHIDDDVSHAIEKEDDAQDEEEVIVPGDHVFGTEIHEGKNISALGRSHERCIFAADAMGHGAIEFTMNDE